jgi:quinol monooxygenase YgiN
VTHAKITAILVAKPGKADALKELLAGMVKPCRAEPGNLRWDIWQDQADPNRFVLDELYVDSDAVAAHRATPHFQNYVSKIADLADRTAIVSAPVEVE